MLEMKRGDANEGGEGPNDQLYNVVYHPQLDRFFLEDEAVYQGRIERKTFSIPWGQWIVPPKSPSKRDQLGDGKLTKLQREEDPAVQSVPSLASDSTLVLSNATAEMKGDAATLGNEAAAIPALDFSSFHQPLCEASAQISKSIAASPIATMKPKKTRVQNYTVHFKQSNQDVAKAMAASVVSAEPNDEHEVKWNGEVIHVQIPGLQSGSELDAASAGKPNVMEHELLHRSSGDQWSGSTFELKNLMRIRAHADGLRGVNSANRFVAVSSSESSESEEEVQRPSQQESEEEDELMPVFFRDDRVLFHAKHRWFQGIVRRRIPKSDFYNIRADNGTLFEAVLASKIELLDEPEELPYYDFMRGDKVLWIPDINDTVTTNSSNIFATTRNSRARQSNNPDEELTYKAKIMQVRLLNRFDLLLRTGRVVKKVPYEQIRPRDVVDFVSTSTSWHR